MRLVKSKSEYIANWKDAIYCIGMGVAIVISAVPILVLVTLGFTPEDKGDKPNE